MNTTEITAVATVGAGQMGRQIALLAALRGFSATLADFSQPVLDDAAKWTDEYLDSRVAKGKLTAREKEEARARIRFCPTLAEAVNDAELVIEAIVEKLEPKRRLFAELDALCPPSAILASNSSSFVSSKLAASTKRPDKVLNMHFFNPALVMELVEVVQGPQSSEESVRAVMDAARAMGKTPILLRKEINGFVVNRILGRIYEEACRLYEQGVASFEDIDTAVEKGLRHPLGPFKLMDMAGLDTCYLVRVERFAESGSEMDRPPEIMKKMYEDGRFGRKTGRGFYEYPAKK